MKQIEVRRENKIKRNAGEQILQAIIYLIIILLCLAILLPCLNVLVLSFNDGKDAARGGIWFWPRQLTLDNFREVFKDGSIMGAYGISIARTVIGTFLSLMVTTLAGYALKQKDLPGRRSLKNTSSLMPSPAFSSTSWGVVSSTWPSPPVSRSSTR